MLRKSEYATAFHTVEWHKIISSITNEKCYFLIAKKGKLPVGVFSYYSIKKYVVFNIKTSSTMETRYGGPIAIDNDSEVIKMLVKSYQKGLRTLIWYLKTPPRWDASILKERNYNFTVELNSILNLDHNESSLWKGLNKKTRNSVRKAEKSGVQIEESGIEAIDVFYNMILEVYSRSEASSVPPKLLYESLLKSKDIESKLLFARYSGKYVAGLLFLKFKDTVVFIAGASHKEYLSVYPNNVLFWYAIKLFRGEGYKKMDLLGIDIERIARFKRGFGGNTVEHYSCTKKSNLFNLGLKLTKFRSSVSRK